MQGRSVSRPVRLDNLTGFADFLNRWLAALAGLCLAQHLAGLSVYETHAEWEVAVRRLLMHGPVTGRDPQALGDTAEPLPSDATLVVFPS